MEMLVVLHEGTVTGPVAATTAMWSGRSHHPHDDAPVSPETRRHVCDPHVAELAGHRRPHDQPDTRREDGRAVNSGMMGGATSMMNGQWGPGMVGAGWQAANGTFGMMFTFTTA